MVSYLLNGLLPDPGKTRRLAVTWGVVGSLWGG
jgi:hypothetical protein